MADSATIKPSPAPTVRYAFLDGMRCLSIVIVILCHYQAAGYDLIAAGVPRFLTDGRLGVGVFFTISGFLITYLLLHERHSSGRVSLPAFYVRRAAKLVPALYVYVAFCAVALWYMGKQCTIGAYVSALTFTKDFVQDPMSDPSCTELVHTWSLTVEETFYLFCAPVVALAGVSRAWLKALSVIFIAVVFKGLNGATASINYAHYVDWYHPIPVFKHLVEPTIGALAAVVVFEWQRAKQAPPTWLLFAGLAGGTVGTALQIWFGPRGPLFLSEYIFPGVFVGSLIGLCIAYPQSVVARGLSLRPLAAVGRASYSLYLWQQFFILFVFVALRKSSLLAFSVSLVGTAVFTFLSYNFVELPMQRVGRRISARYIAKQAAAQAQLVPVERGDSVALDRSA